MARITGSSGARTAAAIRRAALRLIYRHGFAAMNLRDLAAEVGIQPSSLYNHIASKQALLSDLMQEHMEALLAATDAALAAAGPGVMDRLRAFLGHHVLYHMERRGGGLYRQLRVARAGCTQPCADRRDARRL